MAKTTETPTTPAGGVRATSPDVERRLNEAFPEANLENMGDKLRALGGTHNLSEKWDRIIRDITEYVELVKSVQ